MTTILVSQIADKLPEDKFNRYLDDLPKNESDKIIRFRRWQDAHLALAGKLLLKKGLSMHGYAEQVMNSLQYTSYNKPFIKSGPYFNISHSGNYAICVLSDDQQIGVDIEKIQPIDLNDFQSQWNKYEWELINKNSEPLKQFYSFWTRKEALIKADGRGLSLPLNEIDVRDAWATLADKRWFISEIGIDKDYCCHVASENQLPDTEKHFCFF